MTIIRLRYLKTLTDRSNRRADFFFLFIKVIDALTTSQCAENYKLSYTLLHSFVPAQLARNLADRCIAQNTPRHYESAPICFQMFEIRNPKRDTNRMCTIKTYFCSIQTYLYNNSKTEPSKQVAAEVAVRGWGWGWDGTPSANLRRPLIAVTELNISMPPQSNQIDFPPIRYHYDETKLPTCVCAC